MIMPAMLAQGLVHYDTGCICYDTVHILFYTGLLHAGYERKFMIAQAWETQKGLAVS